MVHFRKRDHVMTDDAPHVQIMEAEYKEVTETEKAEVVDLGGLHVVGTERHESRRIDNQLRGRGGRYPPSTFRLRCIPPFLLSTCKISGYHGRPA